MPSFFNPFPKYLQIRQLIVDRIGKDLHVGSRMPTEHEFSAEFGVSRETVRAALSALEEEGIISRTPGRGTFVQKPPPPAQPHRLTGLTEDFSALKFNTEARILETGEQRASHEIAEAMGVETGTPVWRVTRLRLFEREPLARHEAILPIEIGKRVAKLDLRRTSMYRELKETLKIDMREDYQAVDAVVADPAMAELLKVPIGAPLLHLTRLYLSPSRQPIVLFRSLYRSDRYYYTIKLAQPETKKPRKGKPATKPASKPTLKPASKRKPARRTTASR